MNATSHKPISLDRSLEADGSYRFFGNCPCGQLALHVDKAGRFSGHARPGFTGDVAAAVEHARVLIKLAGYKETDR